MTGRERIIAALNRQAPDMVPTMEWIMDPRVMKDMNGAESDLEFAVKAGLSGIAVSLDYTKETIDDKHFVDEWGVTRVSYDDYPNPVGHPVKTMADFEKHFIPDPDAEHRFDKIKNAIKEVGDEIAVVARVKDVFSQPRDMMAFETREWEYGHRAIVTTVQVEKTHEATAWQRFLPSGPLAFRPLPDIEGRHYCSIVWSVDDELVDDLLTLEEREFCRQIESAIEGRLGTVMSCSGRFAFPLRQRHAVNYVQPGVALVGDAAHTIHPLAGQGINLGLQDVAALAEEVLTATSRGTNPGQVEVLKCYQRRRKGENLAMMAAMDGFKRLFAERSLPVRWLRNAGMRGIERFGPLKQQLMRHAMGIGR